jgi:regulator of replication initiation timing
MSATGNLSEIIERQRQLLTELEAERKAFEASDLVKENSALKTELDKLRAEAANATEKSKTLGDENTRLKNSLYGHIYNEKVRLVDITEAKLEQYFKSGIEGELDRLTALEKSVAARIIGMRDMLVQGRVSLTDELYAQLNEYYKKLEAKLTEIRANAAALPGAFSKEERDALAALKAEQISDEQIRAVAKKSNLERFVGLNVLNALGVLLLIIGAVTLSRFVYAALPDTLKGILLFLLGGALLGAGELVNRKRPNVFSLGLSAGGIGVLYAALAASYFSLNILDALPAVFLCVLITAGAFLLSVRYDSRVIASFALVGGYLPMFSLGSSQAMLYGAMVYFVALNLLALLVSFKRRWIVPSFIGLGLNIAGSAYIGLNFLWTARETIGGLFIVVYLLFAFIIYTAIPVISVLRTGERFKKSDVVLLAVNTFFSSLIIYGVFYGLGWERFTGLLAVVFAAVYLLLGVFIDRSFSEDERHVRGLFYLTGLAFVVLVVPLQFGMDWLTLGWLAEGVFVSVYGVVNRQRSFKQAGMVICLLCLGAFLLFNCTGFVNDGLFAFKYFAVTAGGLGILAAYMYIKETAGRFVNVYKYFAITNLWLFAMYMLIVKLPEVLSDAFAARQDSFNIYYPLFVLAVAVTFFLAYFIPRVKLLYTGGMQVFSVVMYAIGIAFAWFVSAADSPVARSYFTLETPSIGVTVFGTFVLAALALMSALALRDMLKTIITRRKLGIEWYPIIISAYIVIMLTQNLVVQYRIEFSSFVISIIYTLTALGWIIFGFVRRYSFIRRFGLGLAVLSVVKLFILDLATLTSGYRVVSYFALGTTLIAISFLYQYFSKRLELKEETTFENK